MLKLRIAPTALKDMLEIKEYIQKDSPIQATKFAEQIQEALAKLLNFPNLGMKLDKKVEVKTDYLYLIWQDYIIFYKQQEKHICVYRVLRASRDYMRLLNI